MSPVKMVGIRAMTAEANISLMTRGWSTALNTSWVYESLRNSGASKLIKIDCKKIQVNIVKYEPYKSDERTIVAFMRLAES